MQTNQARTSPCADGLNHLATHHFDSRRWSEVRHRKGDIIISSWAKSGTTWLQQIVVQMVHDGAVDVQVNQISPWVDFRLIPIEDVVEQLEGQNFRRVMKSHLPADAIPLRPQCRYLYIARHPIDVAWSWYAHHNNFTDQTYHRLNETPGLVGPKLLPPDPDFGAYFRRWLADDGYPFHPYWRNVATWWRVRNFKNVKLLHFMDLRCDFELTLRRLAKFLDIRPSKEAWLRIQGHSSLAHMREQAEQIVPFRGEIFKGGAKSFLRGGQSRQWAQWLDPQDVKACREAADRNLDADCVEWLFGQD